MFSFASLGLGGGGSRIESDDICWISFGNNLFCLERLWTKFVITPINGIEMRHVLHNPDPLKIQKWSDRLSAQCGMWIVNDRSKVIRLISKRSQKLPWLSKLWLSWFIKIKTLKSHDNFFWKDSSLWFPLILQLKSSFFSHFVNEQPLKTKIVFNRQNWYPQKSYV